MVVRRGRPLKGFGGDSSSDSDDDAFAAMSKKKKQRIDTTKVDNKNTSSTTTTTTIETSSNKRHHHINAARQAKMDSLLQELQTTKPSDQSSLRDDYYGTVENDEFYPGSSNRFAPDKKGSYVEPGMEHLTSNLFVGNLDPMTTEEELTDCFRQYGDLYSVKIMWPRTAEERARNRNTGFVCFMNRKDAEDAMDSLADADPLGTGRRMNIGWGKNVKKTVKRGTGGVPLNFRKRPKENQEPKKPTSASLSVETGISHEEVNHHQPSQLSLPEFTEQIINSHHPESAVSSNIHPSHKTIPKIKQQSLQLIYDPVQHSAEAIVVKVPSDTRRMQFISTVASFVAKDGSIMEQKLIETQSFNSDFRFLTPYEEDTNSSGTSVENNERFEEHIFYRWRVYAFAQGDGFNSWRTEPFVMFQPHGRYWIPPPLNTQAAQKEEESEKRREKHRLAAQEERRKVGADNKSQDCIKTGAQLRRSTDIVRLNEWEREVFHELLREKLVASQESICEAMAFCFDKSGAAREIASLLKEALLETNAISLETRIARLFLMSDILFNSQQPGVRNAFQYRNAIEAMSPEVFECLGKYECGRMTKNKLRKAVSSVLSAWTNWSVFDSDFIDELERKFEGGEILVTGKVNNEGEQTLKDQEEETPLVSDNKEGLVPVDDKEAPVSTTPRGTWTSATNDNVDADVDGEAIDEDIDGEAIDDLDGEEIDGEAFDEDVDGEEVDIDGLPDTETG